MLVEQFGRSRNASETRIYRKLAEQRPSNWMLQILTSKVVEHLQRAPDINWNDSQQSAISDPHLKSFKGLLNNESRSLMMPAKN